MNSAQEVAKRVVVNHIISQLDTVPANAADELMKESLGSLHELLEKLSTKRQHEQIQQDAQAQIEELRRASAYDGAWAHCLLRVRLNDKVLADTEANRQMMENMLAPHESPSAEIYSTLALTYPQKFSWRAPKRVQTDAEREADFKKACRDHWLSECDANRELHKQGVSTDAWVGCSEVERQTFQAEAAQARQKYLINNATPDELKAEARHQFRTEHEAAVRADVERRETFVAQVQKGLYATLPTVNGRGETMDAAYFRKISTTDYNLFKALVKRHGSAQITSRLRGEN